MKVESRSSQETERLGAELAAALEPGEGVLVAGELGSGKTTFVRGASRRLGVTVPVTSPTFTIGQRYPAPVPVSHVDLYRLRSLEDEDPELLDGYIGPDPIAFVEWPQDGVEAVGDPARIVARVSLRHAGG